MVAQGYGVHGEWVFSRSALGAAVELWVKTPQATVLAVKIDEKLYRGNTY
jgi:hypothetical protein